MAVGIVISSNSATSGVRFGGGSTTQGINFNTYNYLLLPANTTLMLNSACTISNGLVVAAVATSANLNTNTIQYVSISNTVGGAPILYNMNTFNTNTQATLIVSNTSGFGNAGIWPGNTGTTGVINTQMGWFFDVDQWGENNPIIDATWLNSRPAGRGYSMACLFFPPTGYESNMADSPVMLFGRLSQPDTGISGGGLYLKGNTSGYYGYIDVYANGYSNPYPVSLGAMPNVTSNTLHMMVMTANNINAPTNATAIAYFDGVQYGNVTNLDIVSGGFTDEWVSGPMQGTGTTNQNEAQLFIGGFQHLYGTGWQDRFYGWIFAVYLWNRALAPSEVKSLYNSPYSVFTPKIAPATWTPQSAGANLIGLWQANTGVTKTGTVVSAWADQSGGGHTLSVYGNVNYGATVLGGAQPGLWATQSASNGMLYCVYAPFNTNVWSIHLTCQIPYVANTIPNNGRVVSLQDYTQNVDWNNQTSIYIPWVGASSGTQSGPSPQCDFSNIGGTGRWYGMLNNTPTTLSLASDGAYCYFWMGGQLQGVNPAPCSVTNVGGSSGIQLSILGGGANSATPGGLSFIAGTVSEIAFFNSFVSADQYKQWANAAWGVVN